MRAMVLDKPRQALQLRDMEKPRPAKGQVLVRIATCAVCRTDLHVVDGELPNPKLPLIPGHQIVGRVEEVGPEIPSTFDIRHSSFAIGDRVGIPWLGWTDGECRYCRTNRENLCDNARFTGYTIDGGYGEFTVADSRFCFRLPFPYADLWGERVITSVANLTRRDGDEFFEIAPRVPVRTETESFPLEEANTALDRFRFGQLKRTAVLTIST